jgi:FkbM family methyltransferase
MSVGPVKQSVIARLAAWYYRECPIQQGRRIINRVLGAFLRVRMSYDMNIRIFNPMEYNQRTLLLGQGFYDCEAVELEILDAILAPGMCFIDVGCNLGFYTLLASRKVGFGGQVHSFEPSPRQHNHCLVNLQINGLKNVCLNQCALFDNCDERDLFLGSEYNEGINSLGVAHCKSRTCKVQCMTLDHYCQVRTLETVEVLKIDVEGAEMHVLRGAQILFKRRPPRVVLVELNEEYSQSFGSSTVDIKAFLECQGYTLYQIEPVQNGVSKMEVQSPVDWGNLFAVHVSAGERYGGIVEKYRLKRSA